MAGVWGPGSEVWSISDRDWAARLRCAVGGAGTLVGSHFGRGGPGTEVSSRGDRDRHTPGESAAFPQGRSRTPGAARTWLPRRDNIWGEGGAFLSHRGSRSTVGPRAGLGAGCSFEEGKRALTWPEAPRVSQDWAGRLRPPPTPGRSRRPRFLLVAAREFGRRSALARPAGGIVFALGGAHSSPR